jgi:hypothetical protein
MKILLVFAIFILCYIILCCAFGVKGFWQTGTSGFNTQGRDSACQERRSTEISTKGRKSFSLQMSTSRNKS